MTKAPYIAKIQFIMSEQIKRFDPQNGTLESAKSALVVVNHMGSSIHADTGRDAQDLADRLELAVYAVDRPGSGVILPNSRLKSRLASEYVAAHVDLGTKLNRDLESDGVTGVTIFGRSAGGLGASALVNTETLPVYGLQANEAPGWYGMPVKDGKRLHKQYGADQKKTFDESDLKHYDHRFVRPDPSDQTGFAAVRRLASIGAAGPMDIYHNETVWNQPLMREQARRIASGMPHVDAVYGFAERSMMASDELIAELGEELPALRAAASIGVEGARPVQVVQHPNTLHASFDQRAFAAQSVAPLVGRMLQSME